MNRPATPADAPALIRLWNRVFGDDETFVRAMLEDFAGPGNLFVAEKGDGVAAMLSAVPCEAGGVPGIYHYALATAPEWRGKGLMAELMAYAEETERQRGAAFAALIPASASLFDYYARHGYETMYFRTLRFDAQELLKFAFPTERGAQDMGQFKFTLPNSGNLAAMRACFADVPCVNFAKKRTAMLMEAVRDSGGRLVCGPTGYAVYYARKSDLLTAELFAKSDEAAHALLCAAAAREGCEKAVVTLAKGSKRFSGKGETTPAAQVKRLSPGVHPAELYLRFGYDEAFDKDYETG